MDAEKQADVSLFARSAQAAKAPSGVTWNEASQEADFGRRFGIARLIERNDNLIQVLTKPEKALKRVNGTNR